MKHTLIALLIALRDMTALLAIMALVAVLVFCVAPQADADTRIHFGGWSDHPFSSEDYNESHELVALEYAGLMAGTFENSYGEEAWFGGIRNSWEYGHLELSAIPGAVYGHRSCYDEASDSGRQWCPALMGMATWTEYRLEPSVAVIGEAVAATLAVRW